MDPASPQRINSHIPAELATICMKCLEKSAASRYESAKDLADDLRRFANDLPILARRPSMIRRAGKFVRRHRAPVAVSTAVLLLITATLFWQRESAARVRAEIASHHDSAMAFVLINQWKDADRDLEAALKLDPEDVQTLLTIAWLKLEYNRAMPTEAGDDVLEDAVRTCRRVVAIDPTNVRALGFLGVALRRLERYSEAIKTLERVLAIDETSYSSWSNLGALHVVTGDLTSAESCLTKGAEHAGVAQDRWHGAVWRNLAMLELFLGKPEASQHLATAIECDPSNVLSWVIRSRLGLRSSDPADIEDALDDAKHADRIAQFTDPKAKRVRALGHLKLGQLDRAIEQARLASDLGDERAIDELIVAAAEARRGNLSEAGSLLTQAVQAWPAALRTPGGFLGEAGTGDLWIESADEWLDLERDVQAMIADPQ